MPQTHAIIHTAPQSVSAPDFPHAPQGWHPSDAIVEASKDRLPLDEDHWETIRALQSLSARNSKVKEADIQIALEQHFSPRGGIRYLYSLFPKGPVAQGCRLAGLPVPSDSMNSGKLNLQ